MQHACNPSPEFDAGHAVEGPLASSIFRNSTEYLSFGDSFNFEVFTKSLTAHDEGADTSKEFDESQLDWSSLCSTFIDTDPSKHRFEQRNQTQEPTSSQLEARGVANSLAFSSAPIGLGIIHGDPSSISHDTYSQASTVESHVGSYQNSGSIKRPLSPGQKPATFSRNPFRFKAEIDAEERQRDTWDLSANCRNINNRSGEAAYQRNPFQCRGHVQVPESNLDANRNPYTRRPAPYLDPGRSPPHRTLSRFRVENRRSTREHEQSKSATTQWNYSPSPGSDVSNQTCPSAWSTSAPESLLPADVEAGWRVTRSASGSTVQTPSTPNQGASLVQYSLPYSTEPDHSYWTSKLASEVPSDQNNLHVPSTHHSDLDETRDQGVQFESAKAAYWGTSVHSDMSSAWEDLTACLAPQVLKIDTSRAVSWAGALSHKSDNEVLPMSTSSSQLDACYSTRPPNVDGHNAAYTHSPPVAMGVTADLSSLWHDGKQGALLVVPTLQSQPFSSKRKPNRVRPYGAAQKHRSGAQRNDGTSPGIEGSCRGSAGSRKRIFTGGDQVTQGKKRRGEKMAQRQDS